MIENSYKPFKWNSYSSGPSGLFSSGGRSRDWSFSGSEASKQGTDVGPSTKPAALTDTIPVKTLKDSY